MDGISSIFCILTYAIAYVFMHHIIFRLYHYFLNIVLYLFNYSCTNIFHRRSLYTFYGALYTAGRDGYYFMFSAHAIHFCAADLFSMRSVKYQTPLFFGVE